MRRKKEDEQTHVCDCICPFSSHFIHSSLCFCVIVMRKTIDSEGREGVRREPDEGEREEEPDNFIIT